MLVSSNLSDSLQATSRHYANLKKNFAEFVESLEKGLGQPNSIVEGLSVKPNLDITQVEIAFVGRAFQLVFSVAIAEEKHRPIGVVRCYSLVEYPEKKVIDTGGFTFKPNGESNLKDSDNDWLYVNHDWAARCIGMYLVHEALRKGQFIDGEDTQCTTN